MGAAALLCGLATVTCAVGTANAGNCTTSQDTTTDGKTCISGCLAIISCLAGLLVISLIINAILITLYARKRLEGVERRLGPKSRSLNATELRTTLERVRTLPSNVYAEDSDTNDLPSPAASEIGDHQLRSRDPPPPPSPVARRKESGILSRVGSSSKNACVTDNRMTGFYEAVPVTASLNAHAGEPLLETPIDYLPMLPMQTSEDKGMSSVRCSTTSLQHYESPPRADKIRGGFSLGAGDAEPPVPRPSAQLKPPMAPPSQPKPPVTPPAQPKPPVTPLDQLKPHMTLPAQPKPPVTPPAQPKPPATPLHQLKPHMTLPTQPKSLMALPTPPKPPITPPTQPKPPATPPDKLRSSRSPPAQFKQPMMLPKPTRPPKPAPNASELLGKDPRQNDLSGGSRPQIPTSESLQFSASFLAPPSPLLAFGRSESRKTCSLPPDMPPPPPEEEDELYASMGALGDGDDSEDSQEYIDMQGFTDEDPARVKDADTDSRVSYISMHQADSHTSASKPGRKGPGEGNQSSGGEEEEDEYSYAVSPRAYPTIKLKPVAGKTGGV